MKLPPLRALALQTFCAFAASSSVQCAAEELSVTPSAVSQQLNNLEEWLGISLVSRQSGTLQLTPQGRAYYNEVWQAFAIINDATESLYGDTAKGDLVISVLPSFASLWLMPRITDFKAQFPQTKISFHTTKSLEIFDGSDVNLAVRFGNGRYKGMKSVKILPEYLTIVQFLQIFHNFGILRGLLDSFWSSLNPVLNNETSDRWMMRY